MSALGQINTTLSHLGVGLKKAILLESGFISGAAGLFGIGLALIFAQLGWTRTGTWALLAVFVGALLLFVWLVKKSADALAAQRLLSQARLAEHLAPELGTAPTSAVDLGRQLDTSEVSFSRQLAWAHVSRTAHALDEVDFSNRLNTARQPRRRWAALAMAVAALWALIMTAALGEGRRRLATLILDPDAARISDVPLAGDIRITYRYPAYTALPVRVVEGGDGSISAVVGTEVKVQATAEEPPREAVLRVQPLAGPGAQSIPMAIDGRTLEASLSVLRDGRYQFALVTDDGERLEDRQHHAIRAVLDTFPVVALDSPVTDVEVKSDEEVTILWRARDDFGVGEVNLVVEPSHGEPVKLPLSTASQLDNRLEGRYRWAVSELALEAGSEARFYVEALDNDTINGPKRGVSPTRRLVLFSARANHEKLIKRQQEALYTLVDWLAGELDNPFPSKARGDIVAAALATHERLLAKIDKVATTLAVLVADLRDDKLTRPEFVAAFVNVLEHVEASQSARRRFYLRAKAARAGVSQFAQLASQQSADIQQLERDIIYLDDLLAVQRIDELKQTARDLLAAQRQLRDLLDEYKQTQDPALRAELERRIGELRQQMLELLAKMAAIKERLPGEYRNLEAASSLQVGDQLKRLEKMLREGDLEAAARELEQLANMIENMMDAINSAEEEYGGERYAEIRRQLAEFAQEFRQLENQQQALAKRTEQMLAEYRKESIERAGKSLDDFVKKAREKTGEALGALDEVREIDNLWLPDKQLRAARQRLLDLDALLEHRDFAESREMVREAIRREDGLERALNDRFGRYGQSAREHKKALRATREAQKSTGEVSEMLDKLFPDPSEVLSPKQLAQMQRMAQKQEQLEQKAGELGEKMDELSQQMPLFGGEPRQDLSGAQQEMAQASRKLDSRALPKASAHEQRAVEQLGKLRQALEQAAQQGGGQGLPLPLGGSASGRRPGGGNPPDRQDVEIPKTDPNRGEARFRETLREASKQKPPERFEEAVQRYYRELIR